MEKHFLFLMSTQRRRHSKRRISSLSVTGIEMINTVFSLMGNYVACLAGKRRGLESSFPSGRQRQGDVINNHCPNAKLGLGNYKNH